MTTPILCVAAHADDEVLGCGGMLARHASEGAKVTVLLLADGEMARGLPASVRIGGRAEAARRAGAALGVRDVRLLQLPDNRLDTVALIDIVHEIEPVIAEVRPGIVYTHHGGDLNVDHRRVHQAVMTACRPLPQCPVRAIRSFEVLSSTEWAGSTLGAVFRPNLFADVSATFAAKMAALRCYDDEMRPFPHSRSYEAVEALARLRGASAGVAMAEAFMIEREIV